MLQNDATYQLGITLLTITAGATPTQIQIGSYPCANGCFFRKLSGGTLAITNGYGASTANSYILADTETVTLNGPARFYLASAGTNVVVGLAVRYSYGASLFPL